MTYDMTIWIWTWYVSWYLEMFI